MPFYWTVCIHFVINIPPFFMSIAQQYCILPSVLLTIFPFTLNFCFMSFQQQPTHNPIWTLISISNIAKYVTLFFTIRNLCCSQSDVPHFWTKPQCLCKGSKRRFQQLDSSRQCSYGDAAPYWPSLVSVWHELVFLKWYTEHFAGNMPHYSTTSQLWWAS